MFFALRANIVPGRGSLRASTSALPARRHTTRSARSILDDDNTPVDLSEDNAAVDRDGRRAPSAHRTGPSLKPTPVSWQAHRAALRHTFPDGWNPPRKLSREAMDGLRQLHRVDPERFTTPVLAERFRVSPEAVRRILKSRWAPSGGQRAKLMKREAEAKAQYLSLTALRERMEARAVMQSRADGSAARRVEFVEEDADGMELLEGNEFDEMDGLELVDGENVAEPVPARGINSRDKLTFE